MTEPERLCRHCLTPFQPNRVGRPRLYCSPNCTQAAFNDKRRGHQDRERQNVKGPRVALGSDEIAELTRRRREGWTIDQLADAYGVSTRTVRRYLQRYFVDLKIGNWAATFALDKRRPPNRVSSWRRVA